MDALVIAIITAVVTGFISYQLAHRQAAIDLAKNIDESMARDRTEAYKVLWKLTGRIPLYPPAENLTYESLRTLSIEFQRWYFNIGGIYLTEAAREAYFDAQELLLRLSVRKTGELKPCKLDANCDYETVRKQLSTLRTQLTEDLRSRRPPGAPMQAEEDAYSPSPTTKHERGEALALYLESVSTRE